MFLEGGGKEIDWPKFLFFFLGEVKRKKLEDRNSTVTWGFFFSGWIWKKKKKFCGRTHPYHPISPSL